MTLKKSDDAISPVIGVMLMLVITVVIAAVITMFATGMVTDTEPAPTAVFDVHIKSNVLVLGDDLNYGLTGPDFQITHVSGDEIDTKNIEIRLSWKDQYGKTWNSVYSADKFDSTYPNGKIYGDEGTEREQPMYVKAIGGTVGIGLDNYFGDVILKPGLTLTATADYLALNENNKDSQFMDAIFNNCKPFNDDGSGLGIMKYLPKGTGVNVMILHIPSNKAIYDKEVMVE